MEVEVLVEPEEPEELVVTDKVITNQDKMVQAVLAELLEFLVLVELAVEQTLVLEVQADKAELEVLVEQAETAETGVKPEVQVIQESKGEQVILVIPELTVTLVMVPVVLLVLEAVAVLEAQVVELHLLTYKIVAI